MFKKFNTAFILTLALASMAQALPCNSYHLNNPSFQLDIEVRSTEQKDRFEADLKFFVDPKSQDYDLHKSTDMMLQESRSNATSEILIGHAEDGTEITLTRSKNAAVQSTIFITGLTSRPLEITCKPTTTRFLGAPSRW